MTPTRRRVDVNLEELDQVLDGARQAPLSETDYDKLKGALHAWRRCWCGRAIRRNQRRAGEFERRGDRHRDSVGWECNCVTRTRTQWRGGVQRCAKDRHQAPGTDTRRPLPGVWEGNVYGQKEPRRWCELWARRRWRPPSTRSSACAVAHAAGVHGTRAGRSRTRKVRRDGGGDDRANSVRSGVPFYRLEQLEDQLGIPLPAATQWEIVESRRN